MNVEREIEDLRPLLSGVLPPDWEQPVAAGDQAKVDASLRRAWMVVYHRARVQVADAREAEEVAQEVFTRVLARLSTRAPDDEPIRAGYLVRAAQNLLADRWRSQGVRREAEGRYATTEVAAAVGGDAEEEVLRQEQRAALREALRRLPALQAQVLRLRIVEQLSAEETAAVVGRTPEAVRQIQHRGLDRLRSELRGASGD